MFLRVGELISYNNILALSKNGVGTIGENPKSKVNFKVKFDFFNK